MCPNAAGLLYQSKLQAFEETEPEIVSVGYEVLVDGVNVRTWLPTLDVGNISLSQLVSAPVINLFSCEDIKPEDSAGYQDVEYSHSVRQETQPQRYRVKQQALYLIPGFSW